MSCPLICMSTCPLPQDAQGAQREPHLLGSECWRPPGKAWRERLPFWKGLRCPAPALSRLPASCRESGASAHGQGHGARGAAQLTSPATPDKKGAGPPPAQAHPGEAGIACFPRQTPATGASSFCPFFREETTHAASALPTSAPPCCSVPDDRSLRDFLLASRGHRLFPPPGVVLTPVLQVFTGGSDLQVGGSPPHMPWRLLGKRKSRS